MPIAPTTRRAGLAAIAAALGCPGLVAAQDSLPPRLMLVVGFAPGGFADGFARIMANRLTERLGRPVTVENRSGAGGNLAAVAVATGPGDGSSVLVTTSALAINQALYTRLGYRMDQLLPVAVPASLPELLATHPSRPSGSLAEYLAWARGRGEVTLATAGVGTGSHIAAEYFFRQMAGIRVVHVPYRGGAPAVQAALAGEVDILATSLQGVPLLLQGSLRGLAVGSAERNPLLPEVPTFAEAGFAEFTPSSWAGLFVPARAGEAVARRLNAEVNAAMAEPGLAEPLRRQGYDIALRDLAATRDFVTAELERWGRMVRAIGASETE